MARVIVVGGGYAGVWCARRIVRAARPGVVVTLVSDRGHHSFHGWTAEVLTGEVRAEHARVPLVDLLPGVELVGGRVTRIDPERRVVEVATPSGARSLVGDHIVVAPGSRDASCAVPGLAEHAWSLKDTAGVEDLGRHLDEVLAEARYADAATRGRLLTVVVAGGGFTGVEVATAIAQRLRRDARAGDAPRVVLAHSGAQALPSLRPRFDRVADYAVTQAAAAGVEFLPHARLTAVTADGAEFGASGFVAAATVVTAIGQTPVRLEGLEALPRDRTGRLVTDRFLRLGPGLWAGGDGAAVPHPRTGAPCPADALWAIHHGTRIGSNILRELTGRAPRPFRFPGLGQGASLGVGRGIAELYGVPLTGWPAWVARWFFFHVFMPSRRVALAAAVDWVRPHALPREAQRARG
ncbi:MAG TPA: FAD-dependent oxidoreductase [Microbacterium sp.]|uniref:NAD(P)/FAD-dependent oxidoreductase n=1 Tax=Microbacterium sp. TaxID=51671 RepID=UPI002B45E166|nr:FAD-dependent oxidoreductase [Microbacterium sp.]HKT56282.1 FAD-dependent oxidoreductase [Microbacterium sp.]